MFHSLAADPLRTWWRQSRPCATRLAQEEEDDIVKMKEVFIHWMRMQAEHLKALAAHHLRCVQIALLHFMAYISC